MGKNTVLILFYMIVNANIPKGIKYVVGIDEAGRGPVAGSVAVGAVIIPVDFNFEEEVDLRDSKKHTPKQRENWFEYLEELKKDKKLYYQVGFSTSKRIDNEGIMRSIQSALCSALYIALKKIKTDTKETLILLDGGLRAPREFIYQETIIRGDSKEPVISLASIVAKVERDRKMVKLNKRYPKYEFDKHKGYGTKRHYELIRMHGMCEIHRRSFLKSL